MMRCAGIRNRISRGAANTNRNKPDKNKPDRNKLEKTDSFCAQRLSIFVLICLCMIQKMIPRMIQRWIQRMISKLWNKLAAAKTRRRSGAKIIFFRDRTYYVADDLEKPI